MNLLISILIVFAICFSQERDQKRSKAAEKHKTVKSSDSEKRTAEIRKREETPQRTETKPARKQRERPLSEAVKSSTRSERKSKGRLSGLSQAIENKVAQKREQRDNQNSAIDYGYIDHIYGNPNLRDRYSHYRPYPGFIGDLTDIIYVIDGRYPYSESKNEKNPFAYQYYSEYPFADDSFFKKTNLEGVPLMARFDFSNGNGNTDEINLHSYEFKAAYQFVSLNIRYNQLSETIDGLTDRYRFLTIAPGFQYGLENWNTLLNAHIGAGLLDIESSYDSFERSFGGLNMGLDVKTFLPLNLSVGAGISYFALKDDSDDIEDLFNVTVTDFNLTVHVYRFGLKAGVKSERFGGLGSSFSFSQPYLGIVVYF